PVTPSLPFAPSPDGQLTLVPLPGPLFHSGLTVLNQSTKILVVPLPSERCTLVIAFAGSFTSGFSLAIAGSSHCLIFPRKIPAAASGVIFSPPETPSRL